MFNEMSVVWKINLLKVRSFKNIVNETDLIANQNIKCNVVSGLKSISRQTLVLDI